MKEKLLNSLGAFGVILYYAIMIIVPVLPFVFIDVNFFVSTILIAIQLFLPFTAPIFWIWGLISAINGVQDVFAVIYYIATVVIFLPYVISFVLPMFSKKEK